MSISASKISSDLSKSFFIESKQRYYESIPAQDWILEEMSHSINAVQDEIVMCHLLRAGCRACAIVTMCCMQMSCYQNIHRKPRDGVVVFRRCTSSGGITDQKVYRVKQQQQKALLVLCPS